MYVKSPNVGLRTPAYGIRRGGSLCGQYSGISDAVLKVWAIGYARHEPGCKPVGHVASGMWGAAGRGNSSDYSAVEG